MRHWRQRLGTDHTAGRSTPSVLAGPETRRPRRLCPEASYSSTEHHRIIEHTPTLRCAPRPRSSEGLASNGSSCKYVEEGMTKPKRTRWQHQVPQKFPCRSLESEHFASNVGPGTVTMTVVAVFASSRLFQPNTTIQSCQHV